MQISNLKPCGAGGLYPSGMCGVTTL